MTRLDMLFVVGSNPLVSNHGSRPLLNWLRKLPLRLRCKRH
jgi:hypothetical protein